MSSCMPDSGRCERVYVEPFVHFLNSERGTNYRFQACLDVQDRVSPQPEVLYLDDQQPDGLKNLVVERKSIVWPKDYAKHHSSFHMVADMVDKPLTDLLGDAPYLLTLPGPIRGTKSEIKGLGLEILSQAEKRLALLRAGHPISGCGRLWWVLQRQEHGEREYWEPDSGLMIQQQGDDHPSIEDYPRALADVQRLVSQALRRCGVKFHRHQDARCIGLLEYYSDFYLGEDAFRSMLQSCPPPAEVHEVWLRCEVWITDFEQGVFFHKLYPGGTEARDNQAATVF